MKKDMGGAAHALALARLVMQRKLPVRLHAAGARGGERDQRERLPPGRRGAHAQGPHRRDRQHRRRGPRDPLRRARLRRRGQAEARSIDFATLTGAARVALGPELPALFCNDEKLAAQLLEARRGGATTRCGACRSGATTGASSRATSPTSTTRASAGFAGSIVARALPRLLRARRHRLGPLRRVRVERRRAARGVPRAARRRACAPCWPRSPRGSFRRPSGRQKPAYTSADRDQVGVRLAGGAGCRRPRTACPPWHSAPIRSAATWRARTIHSPPAPKWVTVSSWVVVRERALESPLVNDDVAVQGRVGHQVGAEGAHGAEHREALAHGRGEHHVGAEAGDAPARVDRRGQRRVAAEEGRVHPVAPEVRVAHLDREQAVEPVAPEELPRVARVVEVGVHVGGERDRALPVGDQVGRGLRLAGGDPPVPAARLRERGRGDRAERRRSRRVSVRGGPWCRFPETMKPIFSHAHARMRGLPSTATTMTLNPLSRLAAVLLATLAFATPAAATTYSTDYTDLWLNTRRAGLGREHHPAGQHVLCHPLRLRRRPATRPGSWPPTSSRPLRARRRASREPSTRRRARTSASGRSTPARSA